ncbi:MAG: hypothetical protein U1U88_001792 [Lawsonella clevelandensis]
MEHHSQPDSPQKEAGKPDNKLHLTAVSSLLVWAAVAAFCAWLMVSTFYSNLADFTVRVSSRHAPRYCGRRSGDLHSPGH